MPIKALLFSGGLPGFGPIRSALEDESPQEFEKMKDRPSPEAYLVAAEDLEILRQFTDTITDLNKKIGTKGLSSHFHGRAYDKIPIIEADYKSCGRLKRGVEALIKQAKSKGKMGSCIIGVQSRLFDELWEKTNGPRQPDQASPHSESLAWLLRELRENCTDEERKALKKREKELAEKYVGRSDEAALVRAMILSAARSDSPVLIVGDTGTGKEIVSRQIHEYSHRKGKEFVAVNCGSIPRELLESDLFGHVKGAFTGAGKAKTGLWEFAGEGTLFLDEIGDLHPEHQVKILRALEEKNIRRVGAVEDIKVNARVIAATNQDLFSMIQSCRFREDLYYRLAVFFIPTPPLRNHPEDVPLIIEHLWKDVLNRKFEDLPPEIVEELKSYPWSGNVRHLKTILKRLNDMFGTRTLTERHLQTTLKLDIGKNLVEESPVTENDIMLHKARCLKHLTRVHEVVNAIHLTLQSAFENDKTDRYHLQQDHAALHFRLQDLEMLCTRPLLFYSHKLHEEIETIKGKTNYLLNLLTKNFKVAKDYWATEGHHAFKQAPPAVSMVIETLLKNG